jgi:hypothetical protein
MGGVNVRRLAAIDMWGAAGTTRRRRIILVEFVGAVLLTALIVGLLAGGVHTVGNLVVTVLVAGIGANYIPLAWHAITLTPGNRLETELDGVDKDVELRAYAVKQFWILVPFLVLIWGFQQRHGERP